MVCFLAQENAATGLQEAHTNWIFPLAISVLELVRQPEMLCHVFSVPREKTLCELEK